MSARTLVSRISPFLAATRSPSILRLRPIVAVGEGVLRRSVSASVSGGSLRSFSSRPTTSSLNDPSPNWSNRPPKETILLDGCDFEHWLVVLEPPEPNLTRDEIIDSYIKTLAQVVGSEEEARMKLYSVSTKHYFAFGALVSEEVSYKIKALPKVRWVLPDSYLDVPNKDYGGEPFINGEAVPYDPKYHEEWVRNNQRANERSRRNDRPRNFDRSRNFERRRESMQNRDAPPIQNQHSLNQPPPPQNVAPSHPMPMSNRNAPPTPPSSPPGYPNQGGGPAYQGQGGGQAAAYQGGGPAYNGYQGGNPGYQSGGPGYQGGPPHPSSNSSYQGGNPGQQSGGPGYNGGPPHPSSNSSYQAGNTGYQSGGPGYHGGPPHRSSNSSYQAGNGSGYQQDYQTGNTANHQSGGYPAGNSPNYPGGSTPYQARDVPGRD